MSEIGYKALFNQDPLPLPDYDQKGLFTDTPSLLSEEGIPAFIQGFKNENFFYNAAMWATGNDAEDRVDEQLAAYREWGSKPDPNFNPIIDEFTQAAPEKFRSYVARAQNVEEARLILDGLEAEEQEKIMVASQAPASLLFGSTAGIYASPSGLYALKMTKFRQLPAFAAMSTAEEFMAHEVQAERTFEQSKTNILHGTIGVGAFIAIQKTLHALGGIRAKDAETYARHIDEKYTEYNVKTGLGDDVDDLPSGSRVQETDVQNGGRTFDDLMKDPKVSEEAKMNAMRNNPDFEFGATEPAPARTPKMSKQEIIVHEAKLADIDNLSIPEQIKTAELELKRLFDETRVGSTSLDDAIQIGKEREVLEARLDKINPGRQTEARSPEAINENANPLSFFDDEGNIVGNKGARDADELPFVGGDKEVDPPRTTLRINPEDDLDEFIPSRDLGFEEPSVRYKEPHMDLADGERLAPAMGIEHLKDNPVKRILMGSSNYARGMIPHLVEHSFYTMNNIKGFATAIGIDRLIAKNWLGQRLVPSLSKTEELYALYRNRVAGDASKSMLRQKVKDKIIGNKGAMGPDEFLEEVGKAKMRLDDPEALKAFPKEVVEAAKEWTERVFRPLSEAAKKERMFSLAARREHSRLTKELRYKEKETGDPAKQAEETAQLNTRIKELEDNIKAMDNLEITDNFLNRLYRINVLKSAEGKTAWVKLLGQYGYSPKKAEAIRQKIIGEIPYTDLVKDPIGLARSLRERTLSEIPNTALEPFLETNINALGRYYAMRMGADVELFKKFGSVDLKPQIDAIRNQYMSLISKAKSNSKKAKLEKEMNQTIEDVEAIRDRVRGTYGLPDDPDSWTNRGLRIARMWNATSMLTGALAAVPDVGNIILAEGIKRSFGVTFESFFKETRALNLAGQEARLAGEALDMYLSMRSAMFADLGESISIRSGFERGMGTFTQAYFNINLMNPWTTSMKTLTSLISGSRMLEDAILTTRHLRNSGSAKIVVGESTARDGRPLMGSYSPSKNRVTINVDLMKQKYKSKAWRDPAMKGVEPLSDDLFPTFADWKRFIIEHELAHADHATQKGWSAARIAQNENKINRIAIKRMKLIGKKTGKFEVTRLRFAGIDDKMAVRIADQMETYGLFGDHVRIARSHLWEDKAAAEVFRGALGKEINKIIVTPGKGDLPNVIGGGIGHILPEKLKKSARDTVSAMPEGAAKDAVEKAGAIFMSEEMSRTIFQFKSFAIAAQHRVLTPGLQQMNKNTLMGLVALVGLGAVVDQIRRRQYGGTHASFSKQLISAIERSGVTGYITDVMRLAENLQNPLSRPDRVVNALGGPIVQQLENAADVIFDYSGLGNINKTTNKHLIDIAPFGNVAHLQWLNDYNYHALNSLTGNE